MQSTVSDNSQSVPNAVARLQLLHLADSALPIGAMAHSFGVESLTSEAELTADRLPAFFTQWLNSAGKLEAVFCIRAAHVQTAQEWQFLNEQLSSWKPARETREASLRLGKRYLSLAAPIIESPRLRWAGSAHLATAFGSVGAALEIEPTTVAAAFLHQSIFGAISACQRLLPFGQSSAMKLLWELKTLIAQIADEAATATMDEHWTLQPMLDIASMRHPHLTTRLFIS
jgi:urease accessory protein